MRRPDVQPDVPVLAAGAGTGPVERSRRADRAGQVTPAGTHPVTAEREPDEVPAARHPTTAPRRVPAAVIAGVDWVRLMELS